MLFRRKKRYKEKEVSVEGFLKYTFHIEDETIFYEDVITNIFDQTVYISWDKGNVRCHVVTQDHRYKLDDSLITQEKLIHYLSQLTDDMEFVIQKDEIKSLDDHKAIMKKWKKIAPDLRAKFHGVLAEGYINAIGQKVEDERRFTEDLRQYRLFGLLFNGLCHHKHKETQDRTLKRQRTIKNVIHSLSLYAIETCQYKGVNEEGYCTYVIEGQLKPWDAKAKERMAKYFDYYGVGGSELYMNTYEGKCEIDEKTERLLNAELSIELRNDRGYIRRMQYELILVNHDE